MFANDLNINGICKGTLISTQDHLEIIFQPYKQYDDVDKLMLIE
jgi:hypothetical protein